MLNPLFFYSYLKGMLYYHYYKDYNKALKYYQKALKTKDNHAKCHFKVGMCYFKQQDWSNAKDFMESAVLLRSDMRNWQRQLSQVENHLEQIGSTNAKIWWKEVEDIKVKIAKKGGSFRLYKDLAAALEVMLRFQEAARSYQQALDFVEHKDHTHAELYYRMGFCYEREEEGISDIALAKEAYFNAMLLDDKLDSKRFGVGVFHQQRGYWKEANSAYLEWYEQNGKAREDEDFLYKIAMSYDRLYDWDNAEKYYNKALEINYHRPYTHYRLGFIYERKKEYSKAAQSYQQAVNRSSEYKQFWHYRLGYCLKMMERFQEACEEFLEQQITYQKPYGVDDKKLKNKSFKQQAIYTHYLENTSILTKTILYESFHGRLMSCNPYAIFLYCIHQPQFKDFTHIWVIDSAQDIKPEFRKMRNLICIKKSSDAYLKYLARAEFLINNSTFPSYFIRREEQKYLNTWHGTPWKMLGKYIKTKFMEHNNTQRNFLQTTHIINPSNFVENVIIKDYDIEGIYGGKALITGYPRIDITLQKNQELKARFDIKEGEKVVLYAPTFRGIFGNAKFEAEAIGEYLKMLSMMPFKVLFRGHYEILKYIGGQNLNFCSANDRDIDTNELLSIVDILITDYSSIAFDFMVLDKPIIYFVYDYEEYKQERGLYFEIEELSENRYNNISEVLELLSNEEFLSKKNRYEHLKEKFFPYEDGNATKRVVDFFFFDDYDEKFLYKPDKKKNLLFYAGPMIPNGITSSIQNLVNSLNQEEYRICLAIDPGTIEMFPERMEQFEVIKDKVQVLPRVGAKNATLEEDWLDNHPIYKLKRSNKEQEGIYWHLYKRDFQRLYGESHFDVVINFEGYNGYWAKLFAYGAQCMKLIFLHNDMFGEFKKRFPQLREIFNCYHYYDKVISVSKQTSEENKKNLALQYNISEEKFDFLENTIDYNGIIRKSNEQLDSEVENKYFKKDYKIFINMARLSVEKDQAKLIRAFKVINEEHPKTLLLILGDGPLKNELQSLIRELNLQKNVFLLGRMFNPFPYLKRADCFVMSSNHEGQPMTLLEALVLDKAIVATDIPGNVSVLKDKGGLIVENSEDGLIYGMKKYLNNEIQAQYFDAVKYNKNIMQKFNCLIEGK
ncbi:CDP-glycerol glycerophosphotransferase family protein [Helicobacter sp. CaF467b]|uniref:CDP-glycerol glycerophosphotransferase family protein n=1 Tax=Helicobacter sp. CaF467b TaxID=2919923 RepID=UPI001F58F009|nr:CDP-glycerol glycerophosphotransferase family protein [Helicobacter sp. CaF467b]